MGVDDHLIGGVSEPGESSDDDDDDDGAVSPGTSYERGWGRFFEN
jgi:hypothetical protein